MICLQLQVGDHIERIDLGVTNLGKTEIFLGHDWLKLHNPLIDWQTGLIEFTRCPSSCYPKIDIRSTDFHFEDPPQKQDFEGTDTLEEGDCLLLIDPTQQIEIRAKTGVSMELAIKEYEKKEKKHWKETVPEYLHDYEDIFTKQDFDELPPHRPWDHAIELLPGSEEHLDCKIYPLSLDEQ